jgi:hypothetical protein
MIRSVLIKGDGIAACCCARLLRKRGVVVTAARTNRVSLPALLASENTQRLLSDVFESRDLFVGAHEIRRRIVAWGQGAEVVVLPHVARVVSEKELLDRLWSRVSVADRLESAKPEWTIASSREKQSTVLCEEQHFGSRVARTSSVRLMHGAEQDACWVESLEAGWLFLLATGDGGASLICVGGEPQDLLGQSRLVAEKIESVSDSIGEFPAYPRILSNLCGEGWLACGTAAISFDPLCGEGAGNAVREAILATAVIGAISGGFDSAGVLALYSSRLRAGFLRHLEICRDFYRTGGQGEFWKLELAELEDGIRKVRSLVDGAIQPAYRLVGFELQRADGLERAQPQQATSA